MHSLDVIIEGYCLNQDYKIVATFQCAFDVIMEAQNGTIYTRVRHKIEQL